MHNNNFLPKNKNRFNLVRSLKTQVDKKMHASMAAMFIGVLGLGLVQTQMNVALPEQIKSEVEASTMQTNDITEIIFGDEKDEAENMLNKQTKLVATRSAFSPALEVVKKHEGTIRTKAAEKGIPFDVAIGVPFLENGGSETAVSYAGAAGIYQLMPGTAKNLGLNVSRYADDRMNPEKNIEAGLSYLAKNYKLFGDWGLTVWSYHAGEGNVSKALRIYAAARGTTLPNSFAEADVWRQYVVDNNITVHKLLSDPSVEKQLTSKLNDDSAGYPYKVMATAHLFQLAKNLSVEEFNKRIMLFNAEALNMNDLYHQL